MGRHAQAVARGVAHSACGGTDSPVFECWRILYRLKKVNNLIQVGVYEFETSLNLNVLIFEMKMYNHIQ